MNNLMSLISKYDDKVLRVFCRPSFVNSVYAQQRAKGDIPRASNVGAAC